MCVDFSGIELSGSIYTDNPRYVMLTVEQCSENCEDDPVKIEQFASSFQMSVFAAYN